MYMTNNSTSMTEVEIYDIDAIRDGVEDPVDRWDTGMAAKASSAFTGPVSSGAYGSTPW